MTNLTALVSSGLSGLRGNQRPRLLHLPSGASTLNAEEPLYFLGEWGFGYIDWQQFVLRNALAEQADGRWAAKEVGLEVGRQNGKGEVVEGRECLGLFYLEERKLIHSAHEFATAIDALDRMDDRIGQNPSLKKRVRTVKRSHGEEGVYLKDGRSLRYKTRTKGGGRGFGADLLVLDEAMFLAEAFLGALMPVISARRNPQMWYMGSAVDQDSMEHGVVFARVRRRAIEATARRLAYFGWSADFESPADVSEEATADPVAWAAANPSLGLLIDPEHVALEREAMDHRTFCVERLGVGDWPDLDELPGQGISFESWIACVDEGSHVLDPVCFAIDVKPDRSAGAIAVAGRRSDGLAHVEIVDHRPGTGWIAERVAGLVERHDALAVKVGKGSPAESLIPALEDLRVEVQPLSTGEHAQACGALFDAVEQRAVRHLGTAELSAAIRGAVKRPLSDAWAWSRKSSVVDISPLVAGTLALWAVLEDEGPSIYEGRGVLSIS
jgi:hypothetical protein